MSVKDMENIYSKVMAKIMAMTKFQALIVKASTTDT